MSVKPRCGRHPEVHKMNISGLEITTERVVSLLGIDIDYKLNFINISVLYVKKAAGQLNAICRMGKHVGQPEKTVLIQSFVEANFNYCPLVWFLTSSRSLRKIELIQESAFHILFDDFHNSTNELLHISHIL